jgi:hypothetical protein
VEVDLRDVVAVEQRVDEQLLLVERPDRALAGKAVASIALRHARASATVK